jgi:hypothetical protein
MLESPCIEYTTTTCREWNLAKALTTCGNIVFTGFDEVFLK